MEPSKKSTEVEEFLDEILKKHFGNEEGRVNSIRADKCALCGGDAKEFKDALSAKEFSISGMCQVCQDKVWEDEEGD